MSIENNLPYFFESSNRSAPSWLYKGRGLLIAAEILNNEFLALSKEYLHDISDDIEIKFQGLIDGILLLLGFSIENAIKGFIVANKPDFENLTELDKYKFNSSGGHGIKEMVIQNIKNLSAIELDLLERLQETIIWAGRYNSPKNVNSKVKSLHPSFGDKDFHNCSILFRKIESLTNQKWDQNENLYWTWCDRHHQ